MFTLSKLTSATDCDVVLNWAQKEKSDLAYKKTGGERFTQNFSENALEMEAELQVVIAQLAGCQIAIDLLPPGQKKESEIEKKVKLEHKKYLLERKKGGVLLVERELELIRIDKELIEINAFITAVTAHKATLVD